MSVWTRSSRYLNVTSLAPPGTGALLLIEVDGLAETVAKKRHACRGGLPPWPAPPRSFARGDEAERQELWRVRRELSRRCKVLAASQAQPRSRRAQGPRAATVRSDRGLRSDTGSRFPASDTSATATSTRTSWSTRTIPTRWRACTRRERALFEGVVALEGSISGEHGIGFAKAPYVPIELRRKRSP